MAATLVGFAREKFLKRQLVSHNEELVLACLLLLERGLSKSVLPISAVHSLVAQIEPLASRLRFIDRPISYSVVLANLLDRLATTSKLERFTIFDDGNHPQTVYRLTRLGRGIADAWLYKLPKDAVEVADRVSARIVVDNPDREVRLVSSLEEALVV